jgi:hypothetical protein
MARYSSNRHWQASERSPIEILMSHRKLKPIKLNILTGTLFRDAFNESWLSCRLLHVRRKSVKLTIHRQPDFLSCSLHYATLNAKALYLRHEPEIAHGQLQSTATTFRASFLKVSSSLLHSRESMFLQTARASNSLSIDPDRQRIHSCDEDIDLQIELSIVEQLRLDGLLHYRQAA